MTTETKIIENLIDVGWSRETAAGMFDCMIVNERNLCGWGERRWAQFIDWASANERNPFSIEGQIAYVNYTLRNNYEGIGIALRATKTREEAREAFKPYCNQITRARFLTLEEAKARGYEDAGNPELRGNNGAPNA
jgi:hypothetical protein